MEMSGRVKPQPVPAPLATLHQSPTRAGSRTTTQTLTGKLGEKRSGSNGTRKEHEHDNSEVVKLLTVSGERQDAVAVQLADLGLHERLHTVVVVRNHVVVIVVVRDPVSDQPESR